MKISYVEFLGRKYPCCLSLAATERLSAAFGGLSEMQKAISGENLAGAATAVDTVLEILMNAGRIYAQAVGETVPPELPCRPSDLIDVTDGSAIRAIFDVIRTDSDREVEAEPKNGEATQGL